MDGDRVRALAGSLRIGLSDGEAEVIAVALTQRLADLRPLDDLDEDDVGGITRKDPSLQRSMESDALPSPDGLRVAPAELAFTSRDGYITFPRLN